MLFSIVFVDKSVLACLRTADHSGLKVSTQALNYLQHWYPQQGMESPSNLKFQFDGKEDAKKFFYVYENVLIMGKTDEEKEDRLVAHLNAEAFENYFDHFTDKKAPTEEAKSFQLVKKAQLEKFSTKKTESETMKEAVNLTYKGEDFKLLVRASKLYKEANFNDGMRHGMIMEAIKSDEILLQFVLLRKVSTFDCVKDTCLEDAEHQKMYSIPKGVTAKLAGVFELEHDINSQGIDDEALNKTDILCKKFGDLSLLITKSKPKPNIQDIISHKCKKPSQYASQYQMQIDSVQSCNYCGRYGHS